MTTEIIVVTSCGRDESGGVAMQGSTRFRSTWRRLYNRATQWTGTQIQRWGGRGIGLLLLVAICARPAAAQSVGESFCQTALAQTIFNLFQLIQFGGPLVGGVIALGATVALPTIRRSDFKREIKELRNQGIVWGVIVAPLGTTIVQFLLNNVVAGGASCTF